MKKNLILILLMAVLGVSSCSCDKREKTSYENLLIYYGCGYNNLSGYLAEDIRSITEGAVPDVNSDNAIVAFCHNTVRNTGDYQTKHAPCLIKIYRRSGYVVRDTLKVYPEKSVDTDPEFFNSVLSEIKNRYQAKHYGLIFSSHGSGWLPESYYYSPKDKTKSDILRSIGSQYDISAANAREMDIRKFAEAIPMHLDYMILDCCLMGCVEVAYEVKDKCSYFVASPTEILTDGLDYVNIPGRLLSSKPDLEGVCLDYYSLYEKRSNPSATISLVDCSMLTELSRIAADIISAHREEIEALDRNRIQSYARRSRPYFYDFRHILESCGATQQELELLDSALEKAVLLEKHTEYFLRGESDYNIKLDNCSGMSMYLPGASWTYLNDYYKTLAWNKQVKLVE